jgi:hypothetical protein
MADEQEITFDESAVAEPEIEPAESSGAEPEKEPDESAAAEGDSGESGCPMRMGYIGDLSAPRCRRKHHIAPDGVDEQPVCLMHSKDPNKQSGPLFDAFWREFEGILNRAGEGEAHFEFFVFPELFFRRREFLATCRFECATFTQDATFIDVTFEKDADFRYATFTEVANFLDATFRQNAHFSSATFTQGAVINATFWQDADFSRATFTKNAIFVGATFTQDADFSGATFTQDANFLSATFTQNAGFSLATFKQGANFSLATFTQSADFSSATFTQNADFDLATFTQSADFRRATFTRNAGFVRTNFHGMTNWRGCRFLDQAEFRLTVFESKNPGTSSAVFSLAKFAKPGEVMFDNVDLSRALFHNCDVSQVWFTPSVQWAKRDDNRGLAVFEETIPLEQEDASVLQRDGQRDYRAVAQIYQQLKKNYDSRLDYWTANEFHFGEMEMKRLAGPTDGPLLGLRRRWHPRMSLVALYRWASEYGNSYGKPMLWLLATLVLFAAVLPLPGAGLKRQGAKQAETYASVWNVQKSYGENLWTEARLVGKGAITSVDAATFQKSAEYAPAYPWGRVLAIFETLLTSSLFALFLLALRRQFRR